MTSPEVKPVLSSFPCPSLSCEGTTSRVRVAQVLLEMQDRCSGRHPRDQEDLVLLGFIRSAQALDLET